jgi:hypothetical protein
MGYICARLIVLLADVRPYIGWYWLLAVASGIVVVVAPVWAVVAGFRSSARWPGWLLLGYIAALVGGMRYYLSLLDCHALMTGAQVSRLHRCPRLRRRSSRSAHVAGVDKVAPVAVRPRREAIKKQYDPLPGV